MPDDPRLEPVIAQLERDHIVLLGHQAEPLNCWLPFEKMTVRSDREYFREHPQYYMYQHPEMPSHEVILAARDRMLRAHPALQFDAVHLASLEWDVDKVADFLDRFPNARVDIAARLVHLEYQAAQDPVKVRRFLMRYQDRILYGSDEAYGPDEADPAAARGVACRRGSPTGASSPPRMSCTRRTSRAAFTACTCRARWSTRSTGATHERCFRKPGATALSLAPSRVPSNS